MTPPDSRPFAPTAAAPPGSAQGPSGNGHSSNGHSSIPPAPPARPAKRPWYRRGTFLVLAALAVLVAASVISDLPRHKTKADQVSSAAAVITAIDTSIHPCAYAVSEAFSLYQREESHALTASEHKQVPGLMTQDSQACSLTSQSIVNLGTLTLPASSYAHHLSTAVRSILDWATSDAVAAVDDLQTLIAHPRDARVRAHLGKEELLLATDRLRADHQVEAARRTLGGPLPLPRLPALPLVVPPAKPSTVNTHLPPTPHTHLSFGVTVSTPMA
ncbi:MAG: hypothetical protein ACRDYD_07800 [Acidimicrobiales bacterium]